VEALALVEVHILVEVLALGVLVQEAPFQEEVPYSCLELASNVLRWH
jgi:hypothetical protein